MKAQKEKGRWQIRKADFDKFHDSNARKIKKIQKQYISLWRQGLTVMRLKERTREDFEKRGIVYGDLNGFAEQTIYNHLMANRGNKN